MMDKTQRKRKKSASKRTNRMGEGSKTKLLKVVGRLYMSIGPPSKF